MANSNIQKENQTKAALSDWLKKIMDTLKIGKMTSDTCEKVIQKPYAARANT